MGEQLSDFDVIVRKWCRFSGSERREIIVGR